ncbi:uncharacterized protein VTP21DRAFT_4426 [Calcarisporiella thermophila]|uniref:uncharacterized protein n=1 Tax=Calcarisporiella thermophila TaxID=911321 RepID=UPI0037449AA4
MSLSDETIKKVFIELQNQMAESNRQLSGVKAQMQAKEREKRLAELTKKELSELNDGVRTYKSVGKAFFQTSLSDLQNELKDRIESNATDIQALEKKQKYLERNITEHQNNLREILSRN